MVSNVEENLFAMRIFMGKQDQMYVIPDTASDIVAVESVECELCEGAKFDINPFMKNAKASLNQTVADVDYGDKTLTGKWASTTICITLT